MRLSLREIFFPMGPTLKAYLDRCARGEQSKLAARIGCSQSHLSDLARGHRSPSLELAHAIERATNGAVPMSSWVDAPAAEAS